MGDTRSEHSSDVGSPRLSAVRRSAGPPEQADVVVVGAGLAGMAAAREVAESGRDVVVLEASDGVGGRVRTDEVDGFLLDRGFQVLLTDYPELKTQVDLHALDLRRFEPGAVVYNAERFAPDRFRVVGDPLRRPKTLYDTALAPIGSVADKARILAQRFRLQRADPRDLLRGDDRSTRQALVNEGFSDTIIEQFFEPLVGGIQLDPSLSTSRRMFDVIFRCLIQGDVAVPAQGMGRLADQMADYLPDGTIYLNCPVASVQPGSVTLADGRSVAAERVVVATEGPAASELLDLPLVESNPATCVWYAADASPLPSPLDKPYVILCRRADGPALNVVPMSVIAPAYAPAGQTLIAAACPGIFEPDAEEATRDQLRDMFGPLADKLRHLRTDAIAHGQPRQHPPFSPKRRVSLGDGLFVCGDHRDTSSLQGAMFSGRRTGEAVVESLA